ncbi:MAG: DNA ligase D [Bacteroidetes bacterium]|nr:DNA ligase D [Bacteroidota bacterium]
MLARLAPAPFENEEWQYEVKWDGYRAVAFMHGKKYDLRSRNDKSFAEKFYPVFAAIKAWGIDAVVDGEIVVVDDKGLPRFNALQNWRSEADGVLIYYVFDIMWLDGRDLTQLPLADRHTILASVMPRKESIIRMSETFDLEGGDFFDAIRRMGMEGIMAKRKDSTYQPDGRSGDWMKIKSNRRQEMVIGGYTINEGTSKPFSSLLVGVYEGKKLVYTGKVGTGFNTAMQKDMMKQFAPLVTDSVPFTAEPDINKPSRFNPDPPKATAVYLKPKLVCEVSYAEMTGDGIMRHPSFEGMRSDKNADKVVLEKPTAPPVDKLSKKIVKATKSSRKTLLNPTDETQVRRVNGHELKFTNLSKLYWPEDKVTKRDMINYYYQVAPFILPYLKDRPQSLKRYPDGIHGENFFQKDFTGKAPDWIKTYRYHSDADDRDRNYIVGDDEATLFFMVSLGSIELNPWSSRVHKTDYPDWCVIDLDPDQNTFDQVIRAAQVTHDILDSLGVPSYCKTSGSTGLHIYIPLGAKYTYEQSKEFGRVIATLVHRELPKFTSIERKVADREGKMYIDFLQNRPQATLAAPYSLRPKPGATVSTPLLWEEVKKGLRMKDFTIRNAVERFTAMGDIFKPVLGKGINMEKVVKQFGQAK